MKRFISVFLKTIMITMLCLVLHNSTNAEASEDASESKTFIGDYNDNDSVKLTETITFFSQDPLPERSDDYVIITRNYDNRFDVVIDSDHSSTITITRYITIIRAVRSIYIA